MTEPISPRDLAEPALESSREALRVNGSCKNLVLFCRDGRPLVSVLHSATRNARIGELLGKFGRRFGADLIVRVADSYRIQGDHDQIECLSVLVLSASEEFSFRQDYRRDDARKVVAFEDVVAEDTFIGPALLAFRRGLTNPRGAPEADLRGIVRNLERLVGKFPIYSHDAEVRAVITGVAS